MAQSVTETIEECATPSATTLDQSTVDNMILDASIKAAEQAADRYDRLTRGLIESTRKDLEELKAIRRTRVTFVFEKQELHLDAKVSEERTKLIEASLGILKTSKRKNVALWGPTGSGKTHTAHLIAKLGGKRFASISCSMGMSESWLLGRHTPVGFNAAQYIDFYTNGGAFLFDEIDASSANIQVLMNSAIENGFIYNPMDGKTYKRHPEFWLIAGANTSGLGADQAYTARDRLDQSTRGRYTWLYLGYDRVLEESLCSNKALLDHLHAVRDKQEASKQSVVISTRDILQFDDNMRVMNDWQFWASQFVKANRWQQSQIDSTGIMELGGAS